MGLYSPKTVRGFEEQLPEGYPRSELPWLRTQDYFQHSSEESYKLSPPLSGSTYSMMLGPESHWSSRFCPSQKDVQDTIAMG